MRPVVLLAKAEAEMLEAAAFYDRQQRALSKRYLAAVQDALVRVRLNPEQYPVLEEVKARRCLVRVFPYAIVFRIVDETVVVISMMHLSRDPEHLKQKH